MTEQHQQLHQSGNTTAGVSPARRERRQLSVGLAVSEREIHEAKKLRYRVFADEMGARLPTKTPGVDHDFYDP